MKSFVRKRVCLSGIGLACLLLAAFVPACEGPDDATITSAVKAKIAAVSPALASAVTVTTMEGVVTLTGAVDSDAIKTKVEQDAKSVNGVKSVVNNLTVKPPITFSEDSTIKNIVMANLAAKKITGVTVQVVNGEVILKGTIDRAKLLDAMMAANDAKPKKVINQLNNARPGATSTELIINTEVENMRKGTVITTCPVSMYVGETRTVELVLSPDLIKAKEAEDQAKKEISNQAASTSLRGSEARVESTPAQFSCFMEAKLTGQGFEVSSVTPDHQLVVLSQNTKWMWNVKAISTGDQTLSLSLNAIFENVGPEKTRSVNTLTKVVKVETLKIPWTTRVRTFVSNNWQWSMTALLLPLAAWIWSQIRKKKT